MSVGMSSLRTELRCQYSSGATPCAFDVRIRYFQSTPARSRVSIRMVISEVLLVRAQQRRSSSSGRISDVKGNMLGTSGQVFLYQPRQAEKSREGPLPSQAAHGYPVNDACAFEEVRSASHAQRAVRMAYEFRQGLLGSERHNLRSIVSTEHVDPLKRQGCQRESVHGPTSALLEPWVAPGQLLRIVSERNESFRPQF